MVARSAEFAYAAPVVPLKSISFASRGCAERSSRFPGFRIAVEQGTARDWIRRASWLGYLYLVTALMGCEADSPESADLPTESTEKSPNAGLLPAPLPAATGLDREEPPRIAPSALGPPKPFPLEAPLPFEERSLAKATGFSFRLRFIAPNFSAQQGASGVLAPEFFGEIRGVDASGVARQRLVLAAGAWLLPRGTELRSRSDRLGQIVVWPEGRSYRVVPAGALLSLLLERRVDGMPRFAGELDPPLTATPGKGNRSLRVRTPIGSLSLEGLNGDGSGELLCRTLFELVRARSLEACGAAGVPGSGELTLEGGETVRLVVSDVQKLPEVPLEHFLTPPLLPIFKPGELPPGPLGPWPLEREVELWAQVGMSPTTGGAPERITFHNRRGYPLLLFVQDRPIRYLGTQEVLDVLATSAVRYEAKSFLGVGSSAGGPLNPGTVVSLGGLIEVQSRSEIKHELED